MIDVKNETTQKKEKQVVEARDYQEKAYNHFIANNQRYVKKKYSPTSIINFDLQYSEDYSGKNSDHFNAVNMFRDNSTDPSLMSKNEEFLKAQAALINRMTDGGGKRKSNRKSKKRKFKKRKSNKRKIN